MNTLFGANGSLLGLLTILVGIFSLLHAYLSYRSKTLLDARNRTTQLFEELYSLHGYSRTVAPVFNVMLKWNGLDEPLKSKFRKIIIDGWVGFESSPASKIELFGGEKDAELTDLHYKTRKDAGQITEHESLTAFLYFWSKLELMLENKVIDKKLTKSLFKQPFNYYRKFLEELRDAHDAHMDEKDCLPSWYAATLKLETFFGQE